MLASMMFFVLGVSFVLRMNFPLLLSYMVQNTNSVDNINSSKSEFACPFPNASDRNVVSFLVRARSSRFPWSPELQGVNIFIFCIASVIIIFHFLGVLVSAYFYGNFVSLLPSGLLIQRFGPKVMILISVFSSVIVLSLTPLAVKHGEKYNCSKIIWLY